MPTRLFTAKATISVDREQAFNEWHNHGHIPNVFKLTGVVSARCDTASLSEDKV